MEMKIRIRVEGMEILEYLSSCLWAFGKVNLKVGMGSVEMGSGREWERGSGYQELE